MIKEHLIVHHSATPDGTVLRDFDAIKRYHIEHNGWRDIGYHWVVELVNGEYVAIPGRPEDDTGAHCIGHNDDSIGVCLVGDYSVVEPPEAAYLALEGVIRDVRSRHPLKRVGGHGEYEATVCPGKINTVRLHKLLEEDKIQAAINKVQDRAGLEEQTIQFLLAYKYGEELLIKLAAVM